MPAQRLNNLLDQNNVHYTLISHSNTYTAAATGAIAHIPGKEIAKTVMVRIGGQPAMAVIPGSRHLELKALKNALGAKEVQLMTEQEFASAFPDCEIGAMPPFGVLYDLPVYVDERLSQEAEIVFNAGSHGELVRLAYSDFKRLQNPKLLRIAAQTASERSEEERSGSGLDPYF
jgi:Ala-tRNA(Pro) deacylase